MNRRIVMLILALTLAVVGAGLLFVYANQADKRADERYDAVTVLQAVDVIAAGETIEAAMGAGKIDSVSVAQQDRLPSALTETTQLSGLVATTTIYPGEQIIPEKFGSQAEGNSLPIPDDKVAVSVSLTDPARVAGFVTTSSEVAIFVSGTDLDSGDPFTQMILKRVPVIGVGNTSVTSTTTTDESGAQTTEQLPRTLLTLAVTAEEAQKIIYASTNGQLAFALLTEDSAVPSMPAQVNIAPAQ